MSIKVFCEPPISIGYQNNPADSFRMTVSVHVFCSSGGVDDGPRNFDYVSELNVAIGANPLTLVGMLAADIQTTCGTFGYPTPATTDIFGHMPVLAGQLLAGASTIS